jgi:hypothetical protein
VLGAPAKMLKKTCAFASPDGCRAIHRLWSEDQQTPTAVRFAADLNTLICILAIGAVDPSHGGVLSSLIVQPFGNQRT